MKNIIPVITLLAIASCQAPKAPPVEEPKATPFYVGTYTDGESEGIYKYELAQDGTLKKMGLAAKSISPSFLAFSADKKTLVAVNEINSENGMGTVESYQVTGDSLTLLSRSLSGGAHPCHVSVNKNSYVLAANYTGGNVGLLKLNQNGALSGLLYAQQHTGHGTTARQKTPHAHSAWFLPFGKQIVAIDLGTNQLWFSEIDTALNRLSPIAPKKLNMAAGAGPRHLSIHPSNQWMYVLNELNCTITQITLSAEGKHRIGESISTLPTDFTEANTCADIHISADGKHLYASNRGHNSLAIYEVNSENGELSLLGFESTRGDGPRNFTLSPNNDFVLVANQHTNNITSFKRDAETGLLYFVHAIKAPAPVCLLF